MTAEIDGRGSKLKAMLRRADAVGARLCVILGDAEVGRGVVTVKDLAGHVQDEIPLEGAARILADRALAALALASGAQATGGAAQATGGAASAAAAEESDSDKARGAR
jgi:hypothetical protein